MYFLILGSSSNRLSSNNNDGDDKNSPNTDNDGKLTAVTIAQRILSKSNLEKLFDTLINRIDFVTNGCDFLDNILDILIRYIPATICIPLISKDENEKMEVGFFRQKSLLYKRNFFI